jgi:tRNA nucleotidyltransferase/poly(A) polymerase
MSDYIYMLESHLSSDQNRVVEEVQTAAGQANVNVFLTGGAMRDMLAGFRIRDLDFAVEGNALKVAKALCENAGARTVLEDDNRKSAELVFPTGVTAQVAMSRQEKSARAGGKPQVTPATIQEDLRGRDFTCNAIALSLNKASRGLLLDPMNGLADIERHELRASNAYGFYDDPSRLLRLVRFRVRLGFTVEERTQMQVANARDAGVEKMIPPRALAEELRRIGAEDNPADILRALGEAGLLTLFSPVLAGPKMNLPGITRFERISRLLPDDARSRTARFGPFLWALTERLTPKEKQALIAATEMPKAQVDQWQKLEARAKKLERALRSARIKKASQVYHLVSPAAPDEVLFLLYHSALKPVQERLRNYYQKYLLAIQEITAEEWAALGGNPGTSRRHKAREEFITNRLDRRPPRKPATPETPGPAGIAGPVGAPGPAAAPIEAGVVKRTR